MKLTEDSVKNLKTLLQAVSIVKIDRIIIEENTVRGIDDDQTVVIISQTDVPNFNGSRVGLNRLSTLANRIGLLDKAGLTIEAVEAPKRGDSDNQDISSLKIALSGTKFEYRCARADAIKAPKKLNDVMTWQITVDAKEIVPMLLKASNTIDSEQIALVSRSSGEVLIEMVDASTQDTFTMKIAYGAQWIREDEDQTTQSFVHYYAVKTLMPLLKASASESDPVLEVGEEGMLQITVKGHTFTLLPRESE